MPRKNVSIFLMLLRKVEESLGNFMFWDPSRNSGCHLYGMVVFRVMYTSRSSPMNVLWRIRISWGEYNIAELVTK